MSNLSFLERNVLSHLGHELPEQERDIVHELFLRLSRQPNASRYLYEEENFCLYLITISGLVDLAAKNHECAVFDVTNEAKISLLKFFADRMFNSRGDLALRMKKSAIEEFFGLQTL